MSARSSFASVSDHDALADASAASWVPVPEKKKVSRMSMVEQPFTARRSSIALTFAVDRSRMRTASGLDIRMPVAQSDSEDEDNIPTVTVSGVPGSPGGDPLAAPKRDGLKASTKRRSTLFRGASSRSSVGQSSHSRPSVSRSRASAVSMTTDASMTTSARSKRSSLRMPAGFSTKRSSTAARSSLSAVESRRSLCLSRKLNWAECETSDSECELSPFNFFKASGLDTPAAVNELKNLCGDNFAPTMVNGKHRAELTLALASLSSQMNSESEPEHPESDTDEEPESHLIKPEYPLKSKVPLLPRPEPSTPERERLNLSAMIGVNAAHSTPPKATKMNSTASEFVPSKTMHLQPQQQQCWTPPSTENESAWQPTIPTFCSLNAPMKPLTVPAVRESVQSTVTTVSSVEVPPGWQVVPGMVIAGPDARLSMENRDSSNGSSRTNWQSVCSDLSGSIWRQSSVQSDNWRQASSTVLPSTPEEHAFGKGKGKGKGVEDLWGKGKGRTGFLEKGKGKGKGDDSWLAKGKGKGDSFDLGKGKGSKGFGKGVFGTIPDQKLSLDSSLGKGNGKGAVAQGFNLMRVQDGFVTSSFRRCTLRFMVPAEIANDRAFKAPSYLIGPKGSHMKQIYEATGSKLRVRGRGSGHKEGPMMCEADEPLQVCISSEDDASLNQTKDMVMPLFERMIQEYCRLRHRTRSEFQVDILTADAPREY